MLQINPNEVIRISKLMRNSIESIEDNIRFFMTKYPDNEELIQIEKLLTTFINS